MRELYKMLSEKEKKLEEEADRAEDRKILLRRQAKETELRIKYLEEKVHLILHVVDISPHVWKLK